MAADVRTEAPTGDGMGTAVLQRQRDALGIFFIIAGCDGLVSRKANNSVERAWMHSARCYQGAPPSRCSRVGYGSGPAMGQVVSGWVTKLSVSVVGLGRVQCQNTS